MILIFDTCGGLCNQMYDIVNGINFCLKYNIYFTFRYCDFRNDNLVSWTEQPFEKLFDVNLFNEYNLFVYLRQEKMRFIGRLRLCLLSVIDQFHFKENNNNNNNNNVNTLEISFKINITTLIHGPEIFFFIF